MNINNIIPAHTGTNNDFNNYNNNSVAADNKNIKPDIDVSLSNTSKNNSIIDFDLLKSNTAEISALQNNVEVIENDLLPLNKQITDILSSNPTSSELPRLVNEYTSKIDTTNLNNKTILNGNYDIPTNNVIKNVRLVSENYELNNTEVLNVMNKEQISILNSQQSNNQNFVNFDSTTKISTAEAKSDDKFNWQAQNANIKISDVSMYGDSNDNVGHRLNDIRIAEERKASAVYTYENSEKEKPVLVLSNSTTVRQFRDRFFEHKGQLEESLKNQRKKIDSQIRLNREVFTTLNTISQLEGDKLAQNTFSLSALYSSLSRDTLNNLIQFY